jgi:hypothetical protein
MGKLSTLPNEFAKVREFPWAGLFVCSDIQFRGLLMRKQPHPAESSFETGHLLSCEEYDLPCSNSV